MSLPIIHLKEVDSTNSYLLKSINNLSDRQVVIADCQTSGRGRFNRPWISEGKGNIYLSILLKPQVNQKTLGNVSQFMALVITDVFLKYNITAELKWPNDILVEGKKIAGILSETRYLGSKLEGFVIGVGVNLNMTEESLSKIDQPATSLNIISGHTIGRDIFINEILVGFFSAYEEVLQDGFLVFKDSYCRRCLFLGKPINVHTVNGNITGIAKEINDNGSLMLNSEKEEVVIESGEIIS